MINTTGQFQEWLNTQGSDYVLWPESEMNAAQIGFKAGLEAERERIGRLLIERGYWTDEMSEEVLAAIKEADDD